MMIAMQTYHDAYKTFPAAFVSKDGKPLLSWRVALLPFFEDETARELHAEFHLDEPWDSDHNRTLLARMPSVYRCPASTAKQGHTVYLTPRGDATAFAGAKGTSIRQIVDGTSKTIAILEVEDVQAVPWTKPDDWPADPVHPRVGFRGQYPKGINTAFCDGSVHFLQLDVDEKNLERLLKMNDGEDFDIPQ